jgi:type VI secretion system protein ImpF
MNMPPPLLDRLMDISLPGEARSAPDAAQHGSTASTRIIPAFRGLERLRLDAIVRDLEVLLNTRRLIVPLPEIKAELLTSVVEFGLPAVRGTGLISPARREKLRREIETAIQRFEPRLENVQVKLDITVSGSEHLRFRIEASLSGAETVGLLASLDHDTGRFELSEGLT